MEYRKNPPELTLPPPEVGANPALEYTAPPPEFDQGSGPVGETPTKKRRLRQFLCIPAVLLLGFLFLHGTKPLPEQPVSTAPVETVPPETPPVETATEAPAIPEGSVVFDVLYAVREGDLVRYSYEVHDATLGPDGYGYPETPWPISVYAQVSDEDGQAVAPEDDPDIWDTERDWQEHVINAEGLSGELTLTLRAEYEQDGETCQSVFTKQLEALPPAPELTASLEAVSGRDGEIDYTAVLKPQPGDVHDYQLSVWFMGQHVRDGEETTGFSLGDDPRTLPVEGNNQDGYQVRYTGGSVLSSLPEGLELTVYLGLRDASTGYVYYVESNPITTQPAEVLPTYPLADGKIALTVYNDTMTFEVPSPVQTDEYQTILDTNAFPEAEFTEYTLPDPIAPKGYDFAGWVIHVNNPFDLSTDANVFGDYNGDPPVDVLINESNYAFPIGDVLTREDLEKVPPDEDGVRWVNVHAVWIARNPEDVRLYLDDGNGKVTEYGMDSPMASEGYLYLCRYPVPERDGLVFNGWYNEDGERVDLLVSFFSFTPMLYDSQGGFEGYDWNRSQSVHLTAHWRPA